MTCIIRQFGCSCTEQCQDHWEVTKAKLIDLDKSNRERLREDTRKTVNMAVIASLLILVGLGIGLAFVHADETMAIQEKIEAV